VPEDFTEFGKDLVQVLVPHPPLRRRQAVAAGEGTAPGTLIVDVPVPEMLVEVLIPVGECQGSLRQLQKGAGIERLQPPLQQVVIESLPYGLDLSPYDRAAA
jgi:hypothetical protein